MDKNTEPHFTSRHVKVGDYMMSVRTNTTLATKTVILVHGIGVSEVYYRRLANELSSRYRVMNVNMPGYGNTKKPPHALNLDELAGVLTQFIKQENIIKPIIIGQSMGTQIAARLSVNNDSLIEKLILVSPTINKEERSAPKQFFRLMQDVLREPLSMNAIITFDYFRFGIARYLITQRYMVADTIEQYLSNCTHPVMLVRGSRDKIVPRQWVEYLLQTLSKGSIVEIKNAPHNLQFTHPKELAAACINFIEA